MVFLGRREYIVDDFTVVLGWHGRRACWWPPCSGFRPMTPTMMGRPRTPSTLVWRRIPWSWRWSCTAHRRCRSMPPTASSQTLPNQHPPISAARRWRWWIRLACGDRSVADWKKNWKYISFSTGFIEIYTSGKRIKRYRCHGAWMVSEVAIAECWISCFQLLMPNEMWTTPIGNDVNLRNTTNSKQYRSRTLN